MLRHEIERITNGLFRKSLTDCKKFNERLCNDNC